MKKFNVCIHNDFGSILYDKDFEAKNAKEAIKKALQDVIIEAGDIIRIIEAD